MGLRNELSSSPASLLLTFVLTYNSLVRTHVQMAGGGVSGAWPGRGALRDHLDTVHRASAQHLAPWPAVQLRLDLIAERGLGSPTMEWPHNHTPAESLGNCPTLATSPHFWSSWEEGPGWEQEPHPSSLLLRVYTHPPSCGCSPMPRYPSSAHQFGPAPPRPPSFQLSNGCIVHHLSLKGSKGWRAPVGSLFTE